MKTKPLPFDEKAPVFSWVSITTGPRQGDFYILGTVPRGLSPKDVVVPIEYGNPEGYTVHVGSLLDLVQWYS